MRQLTLLFVVLLIFESRSASLCAQSSSPSGAAEPLVFKTVDGLRVERVVPEKLITWPVVADWDEEGRLVVVESGGVGWPIQEHNKKLLHRIVRLIDDNEDGVFDRRIVAVDQLPFTEGVLCLGKSLLAAAPPHIWKFTDSDGDGVCEQREVWFDGQTVTNCANDLHGPYLGLDGWIYWCKGAFGEQTHTLLGGKQLNDAAAHIYRRQLSGGPIEVVASGGMDNPVEIAFTSDGEKFFTSTFLQHPADGKRDGIGHALYGSTHGKDHYVLEKLIQTGPLTPVVTHLGPAAPSGIACLQSNSLVPGIDEGKTLVLAQFNLQKISAHQLRSDGAGYTTVDTDLVTANRIDFHPTDILEDADGSLLILDTGGWYDLCCPSSRVDQAAAPGGIYRLAKESAERLRYAKVDWSSTPTHGLVNLLQDARPWIRRAALLKLRELGDDPAVVESVRVRAANRENAVRNRAEAMWALCSLGTTSAQEVLAAFVADEEPTLAQAACHAVGLHRYQSARGLLEERLRLCALAAKNDPAPVAALGRAIVEALGRVGDAGSAGVVLQFAESMELDSTLRHSIVYALYELQAANVLTEFLRENLESPSAPLAFVALHLLDAEDSFEIAAARQAVNRDWPFASRVIAKRQDWIAELLPELLGSCHEGALSKTEMDILRAWTDRSELQHAVVELLSDPNTNGPVLDVLFQCFRERPVSETWIEPLLQRMRREPQQVVAWLADLKLEPQTHQPLIEALIQTAKQTDDDAFQLECLSSLPRGVALEDPALAQTLFDTLFGADVQQRQVSGSILQSVRLSEASAKQLAKRLNEVAPTQLLSVLTAVSMVGDDRLDIESLSRLKELPAARSLSPESLRSLYRGRSQELQEFVGECISSITLPSGELSAQVAEILTQLPSGDPVRGLQVFRSTKAACSSCHQMGYVGERIGPELTRLGATRSQEALLEAILFPSARIEQGFQPYRLLTRDGSVFNGLLHSQDDLVVRIQTAAGKLTTVERSEVEIFEPSNVSIMPTGMLELLGPQALADLLALLQSSN